LLPVASTMLLRHCC